MMLVCRLNDLPCAEHIIFHRLIWAILHERHMLVGCRMIDDVWMVHRKYIVHPLCIAHRCNEYDQIQFRMLHLQLLLDTVGIIFINIDDNELSGLVLRHLTA